MEKKTSETQEAGNVKALPESCIANILSLTTPRDACYLSLVSPSFTGASLSDTVWERFLPHDYRSILSQSSDPSLLNSSNSKKQLFLSLCEKPVIIDNGKKSFALDKWSGKKCYMLSARDLSIVWGDDTRYWRWYSDPHSRFEEVAELVDVCWLELKGKIGTGMLSPSTLYSAYLVFKHSDMPRGLNLRPVEARIGVGGESDTESNKREIYLDERRALPLGGGYEMGLDQGWRNIVGRRIGGGMLPVDIIRMMEWQASVSQGREIEEPQEEGQEQREQREEQGQEGEEQREEDGQEQRQEQGQEQPEQRQEQPEERQDQPEESQEQGPKKRKDGWLEVELGEFLNEDGMDVEELEASVSEVKSGHWKSGLIIQGIELRPKHDK